MLYYYDGQLRRYLIQVIRLLSNFVVKYGDGTLVRIPVIYGDPDRQVENIINQNSENTLLSAPKIAVYISDFQLDRTRLGDASYIGKINIRERDIDPDTGAYTSGQGANYTVERLMPTPFKLTLKADIWSTSTDQKLQILEQILVLFNPSLEIQTSDNYIDWTSLSVVDLDQLVFTSRQVPTGQATSIDVATLTLTTPVWLTPPAKVKKLGVVTNLISSIFDGVDPSIPDYINGLGTDPNSGSKVPDAPMFNKKTTIGNFDILVTDDSIRLISDTQPGAWLHWTIVLDQLPGKYHAGLTKIYLLQQDTSEVSGTISVNPLDDSMVSVVWDPDTFPTNTLIVGPSRAIGSRGSFDAVIDPTVKGPRGSGLSNPVPGTRYLILENIGGGVRETYVVTSRSQLIDTGVDFDRVKSCHVFVNGSEVALNSPIERNGKFLIVTSQPVAIGSTIQYVLNLNEDGPDAWKNNNGSDFIADANDIIEWDGNAWHVVFSAHDTTDQIVYQTNYYTMVQYKWNGVAWTKTFVGEYKRGDWRLELA
jgi:hypothetical protein